MGAIRVTFWGGLAMAMTAGIGWVCWGNCVNAASEGQLERKGDPLINIDPQLYQAQIMQAEGALERDTSH